MKFIFGERDSMSKDIKSDITINTTPMEVSNKKQSRSDRLWRYGANKASSITETVQNYQIGLFIMFTGCIFTGVSFLFLPLALIKPYKFCALNSLGTATILFSIVVMKSDSAVWWFLGRENIGYTMMYLISLFAELYFSVIRPYYLLLIIIFGINVYSLLILLLRFFSGTSFIGSSIIKKLGKQIKNTISMLSNSPNGPSLPI